MIYNKMIVRKVSKSIVALIIVFMSLPIVMSISSSHVITSMSYAENDSVYEIEDIETLIRDGKLDINHYTKIFPLVVEQYDDDKSITHYLNGVWLSQIREYDEALIEFNKALKLLVDKPNERLQMLILEKMVEIDSVIGNLIDYQSNAFLLKELAMGVDDKLYIKSLYAIAESHFQTYNDDMARSYLSVLYGESSRIEYSLGISLYHSLYGDIELSYNNYDDANYHYQTAYSYAYEADYILGYAYEKTLELQMAKIESINGLNELAYERIGKLIVDISNESDYLKRDIYFEYGQASALLSRYEEAIKYYQLALTSDFLIDNSYRSHSYSSAIYTELGFAYAELNRYEESVGYFEKAYEISNFKDSDEIVSSQVSALNSFEIDELEREIEFKQKLRQANEATIALQRDYLRIGFGLITALLLSVLGMLYMIHRKNRVQKKLYFESITDHLTKVFNRGYIISILEENKKEKACILMMDIDDFKMINDTFGHVIGDKVLVRVAEVIEENLREEDSVGRYGGEEFLVVLRNTDIEKGLAVAERIRMSIEVLEWDEEITTTISIGMMQSHDVDTDELLTEADLLMYRAKSLGKNRVVF